MGNANSNANSQHKPRPSSSSPRPDDPKAPHRSLRQKKKSLELPDLASLGLTPAVRQPPAHSNPINIPAQANQGDKNGSEPAQRPALPPDFSAADVTAYPYQRNRTSSRTYRVRNDTRDFYGHPFRGRSGYNSGANIAPSIPSVLNLPPQQEESTPYVEEIIYSTIPIALPKLETIDSPEEETPLLPEPDPTGVPVAVEIVWRGGGQNVVLARAGDDDWQGRQPMDQDPDEPTKYTTTVPLLPGTHHLRFLVDDQWRVADDMPTAVDDQGTLANYVAVPIPVTASISFAPTPTLVLPAARPAHANTAPALPRVQPGHSFWSSTSDDSSSSYPSTYHPPAPTPTASTIKAPNVAAWTSEIPLELIEAAKEEEAYLAASSATHQTGFIPAPNIPPAPSLPRHLDRLILNGRSPGVGVIGGRRDGRTTPGAGSNSGSGGRRERERDRDGRRDRDRDREREGREGREKSSKRREKERERERDGTVVPQIQTSAQAFSAGNPTEPSTARPATAPAGDPSAGSGANTSASASASAIAPSTALPLHLDPFQDGPGLADDTSVLPVPSHVVLQHLSTSAIRNGVLAVGTTNRYRKKFMTVVYYKPVS